MEDIVERIRGLRFVHVPVASGLMEEAAAEIERLRLELSVQKACTVAGREEIARLRLRLTDEEREAIHDAIKAISKELDLMDGEDSSATATLCSLLERLHT
jgi:hypothetical protein